MGKTGTGAFVGQQLHENGMGYAAVHDDHVLHAAIEGRGAALHLGNHAAGDDAAFPQLDQILQADFRNQGGGILRIAKHAGDIRHHDQRLGVEGAGNIGGGGIPVDIVSVAGFVAADGGNHGDVAPIQQIHHRIDVHLLDFAHEAQPLILDAALQQAAVHAGEADGLAALHLQQVDQGLVDLAGQHHLHDIHGFLVRHAQAVHEDRLLAQTIHQIIDFRPAAVHKHDMNADEPEEHDVLHDLLLELLVDHGVAAVFDDNDLPGILADIGQGGGQHLRALHVGEVLIHGQQLLTNGNLR